MTELLVAPCDHAAAKHAVLSWHYSRSMPVSNCYKLGVWEDGAFVGAIMYSWGANWRLGQPYGLDMTECVELVRVAMRSHEAPVSQAVAQSLRLLKRDNPGVRLVVSFADPYVGHIGGIYQAGNWLYLGESAKQTHWVMPDGQVLNRRAFTGRQFGNGDESRATLPKEARAVKMPGKHRYVYPLDRAMRRRLTPLALPYPRGLGLNSETPSYPDGKSGAIPEDRSTQHPEVSSDHR